MGKDIFRKINTSSRIKNGRKTVFSLVIVLFFLLSSACQHHLPPFTVEPLPTYEALFHRTKGWTGGDGVFSVRLDSEKVLWLFGDTFIGEVQDGRHINFNLVNNTIAVQKGKKPPEAMVDFFYGRTAQGKPEAFLRPADGNGWFWPYHGLRTKEGLFLFLILVERTNGPPAFDFKTVATVLGRISNPDDPPEKWRFSQQRIPWSGEHRLFGSSVLLKGEDCYIFGTVDEVKGGIIQKQIILVRVPAAHIMDFDQWRFYSNGEWVAEVERSEHLSENVANEFSVSFQPALKQYLMVYTQDSFSENMAFRLSPEPQGPWGEPIRFYRCPEAERDPRIFCYAAKGHPEAFSLPGGTHRHLYHQFERSGLDRIRCAPVPAPVSETPIRKPLTRIKAYLSQSSQSRRDNQPTVLKLSVAKRKERFISHGPTQTKLDKGISLIKPTKAQRFFSLRLRGPQ